MAIWINTEFLDENKGKKTTSRDLMSPDKSKANPPKEEVKQIGSGSNDIIERAGQKVVIEDGRELLK
jgi:hypothetical protein